MAADVTLTSAKMPAEETSQMPPAADHPHDDRVSADHPATPSATSSADTAPAGEHSVAEHSHAERSAAEQSAANPASPANGATGESVSGEGVLGGEPHRRRRRRRRRPPRDFAGSQPFGAADAPAQDAAANSAGPITDAPGEDGARSDAASDGAAERDAEPAITAEANRATPRTALPEGAAREGMPGDRPPRRRRRRRRPPPGAVGATPAPGALGSALPPVDAAAGANGDGGVAAAEQLASGERGTGAEAGSQRPFYLRRPVRGRRQLPRPPGLQAGQVATPPAAGETQLGDASEGAAPGAPRAEGEFPRRRRHRRPPPRAGETAPTGEGQSVEGAPRYAERQSRHGGPRGRRPSEGGAFDPQTQRAGQGPRGGGPSRGGEAGGSRRDRDESGGRSRGPGGRDGQRGRGRDQAPRRIEQKLYTLESMVDRGFEDVPDEAEDSGSRRVHWTIVKRTVADQKSGKAMSATYVLQREGGETEFPNLGAARVAANKTIVHPEKLTMSKAEHAAAKNSK